MDFKENPLHQSLISRFLYKGDEREGICPRKIYNVSMIHKYKFKTESMAKGSYFETLALGSGMGGKKTEDLPRKSLTKKQIVQNKIREDEGLALIKGEKRADQVRIDEQAIRFRKLCGKYQITVASTNTQVNIKVPWHKNPDVYLQMELDIFPTAIMTEDKLMMTIIDLKLTANLDSTFGEYCWGSPEHMDHIQAYMYHYGTRQISDNVDMNPHLKAIITKPVINLIMNDQLLFFYWVFEYKKSELRDKFLQITWDKAKEQELHESIRKTINLIDYYEQLDWPAVPDYSKCKDCPVISCEEKVSIQKL